MRLREFEDIKRNLYAVRMWNSWGYIPLSDLLAAARELIHDVVCEPLGIDVDELIESMISHTEMFCHGASDGTVIEYSYAVFGKKPVYYSDARTEKTCHFGGLHKAYACIDLNELLCLRISYTQSPGAYYCKSAGAWITFELCDAIYDMDSGKSIYAEEAAGNPCKRRKKQLIDAVQLHDSSLVRCHAAGLPVLQALLQKEGWYESVFIYDNEMEASAKVSGVFSDFAIISEKLTNARIKMEKVEAEIKKLKKRLGELENEREAVREKIEDITETMAAARYNE